MAAAEDLPCKDDWEDSSAALMYAVREKPVADYIPLIVELFPRFTDKAKLAALQILSMLDEREAALAYVQILRTHAKAGRVPELPISIDPKPQHSNVLFPELLDYTSVTNLAYAVCSLCHCYCGAKLLDPANILPGLPRVLDVYQERRAKLLPAQQSHGVEWMWEDDYFTPRYEADTILSLFGYFPSELSERELCLALDYQDPRLRCAAAVSLIRMGKEVDSRVLKDVAASAEVRNRLFYHLADLLKLSLFPDEFLAQEALAESAMVDWLTFGTELGRVPDEIGLMKVVPVDSETEDGFVDFYVYRFRTYPPHWAAEKGWMAGISGPFVRKDSPTINSWGYTFSSFEAWNARTPEEHAGNVADLIESMRQRTALSLTTVCLDAS